MATQTVLEFIRGLKEQGTPVIFSTHHLDEVQELCDKITVIDQGRTMFDGDIASFKGLAQGSLHQSFMAAIQSTANE
jgi:sodium transport system ATP-binding protein